MDVRRTDAKFARGKIILASRSTSFVRENLLLTFIYPQNVLDIQSIPFLVNYILYYIRIDFSKVLSSVVISLEGNVGFFFATVW